MNRLLKPITVGIATVALSLTSLWAIAGDQSIANFTVSGLVPTYFTVTSSMISDFIDLTPKVVVVNRSIGLMRFKYNQNVQTLVVSSSTVSGAPEDPSGNAYSFGGVGGFKVAVRAGCQSVDATFNTPFTLTQAGTDIHSALSANLTTSGIEEDCELTVSYTGTSTNLPLGGRYTMNIVVTMTAP